MTDQVFPRVTLAAGRQVLRPFEASDAADVHVVWNDEEYLRFAPVGLRYANGSLEEAVEWCTNSAEQGRAAGRGIAFAGIADGRLVCQVGLFGPDWTKMIAEIHYWTAPWARGRGYAAEAAKAVARWALAEREFARITLQAVTENTASLRVAERAGFVFEGVLRNGALSQAGRGDYAVYSMIPADLSASVA
jgi:[ribosomal protein S5]-alanine N-acetyltransferase